MIARVTLAGSAVLLGACAVPATRTVPTHYRPNQDYFEPVGDSRVVAVGQKFAAALVPGTDLQVEVTQHLLCRQAVIGHIAQKFGQVEEINMTFDLWTPVAALLFTPVLPYSVYLWIDWLHVRSTTPRSFTEEQVFEQRSPWMSEIESCPATPWLPAASRTVRAQIYFNGVPKYYYDLVTGPNGRGQANGVLRQAARVATMCGPATLTFDDITADPGYVAPIADKPGHTQVRGEVVSIYDTGTPTAIKRVAFHAPSGAYTVQPDGNTALDGLNGVELATAQACMPPAPPPPPAPAPVNP